MQGTTPSALIDSGQLNDALATLAALEPNDAAFLSCYLDARKGRSACQHFISAKADTIRRNLHGRARFEFENALAMITRQLELAWDPDASGLALFARGMAGGRHLSVLRFALPFANRLVLFRVPEILPLIDRQQREAPITVLLARHGRVQVLDLDQGIVSARAWAALQPGGAVSAAGDPAHRRPHVTPLDRSLKALRRVVAQSTAPLVLAGDAALLDAIRTWLPRRAQARLLDSVALPEHLEQGSVIGSLRERLGEVWELESAQLAAHLVRTSRTRGLAVAGPLATRQALREGLVDTLVIADNGLRQAPGSAWDEYIDLSRLAWQRDAQVVFADSDELRYLGGVGCLLRQPPGSAVMPRPVQVQPAGLVA